MIILLDTRTKPFALLRHAVKTKIFTIGNAKEIQRVAQIVSDNQTLNAWFRTLQITTTTFHALREQWME